MREFVLVTFLDGRAEDGGAYVHKRNMLRALCLLQSDSLRILIICSDHEGFSLVNGMGLIAVLRKTGRLRRFCNRLFAVRWLRNVFGRGLARLPFGLDYFLRRQRADLVLFSGDDTRVLQLLTHNYIVRVWDLCHLEQPEFPEVSQCGEFERREYLNWSSLRRATAVIVDSNYGKKLITQYYSVDQSRIFVAPFVFSLAVEDINEDDGSAVRKQLGVWNCYIFYPAQFWPHKNHRYILHALRLLLDQGSVVPQAVFCGSDKGALGQTLQLANELGVEKFIKYLGHVSPEEMVHLYRGALALVMPTYFGPTNIPPCEARALGVPVCYSDLPSFREQMGDDALYMDLQDPGTLAQLLEQLLSLRSGEAPRGLAMSTSKVDAALHANADVLREIIASYSIKLGPGIRSV